MSGEMDCSKRRCCRCRKHQMSYSYTRVMGAEVGKGLQKAGAHVPGHRRRSRICQSSTGRQSCRCLYPLGSSVRTGTPSSALIGSHNQPQADSLVCLETINALSRATYRGTANIEHAKAAAACVGRIARAQVRYTGLYAHTVRRRVNQSSASSCLTRRRETGFKQGGIGNLGMEYADSPH